MSVRTISDERDRMSALYDSVSGIAFGPIFHNDEGSADDFLEWYNTRYTVDTRELSPQMLLERVNLWHAALHASQPEIPF
jgi:hypothetical protein